MWVRSLISAGFICLAAASGFAQSFSLGDYLDVRLQNHLLRSAMADDAGLRAARATGDPLGPYLKPDPSGEDLRLTIFNARFLGIEPYEASRPQMAFEGAAAGATLGMFLGAAGSASGLFGEETAWYVAGAMAAAGAIFGGTFQANDPANRLRWRWRMDADTHWATQDGPKELERR